MRLLNKVVLIAGMDQELGKPMPSFFLKRAQRFLSWTFTEKVGSRR